jgi:hypothetical protein
MTSALGGGDAQHLQEIVREAYGARPERHALRRDGLSPATFDGRLLAKATGCGTASTLWYELAAYARAEGGFVASMKVFKKSADEADIHWARSFPTAAELCAYFEGHDPTRDVTVPSQGAGPGGATAAAVLQAVALRQRLDEARMEYEVAVGDLLTVLHERGVLDA